MDTDYISPTKMMYMNMAELRKLDRILIIQPRHSDEKLGVLMPYAYYLEMQSIIIKAHESIEGLIDENKLELKKLKGELNA